MPSVVAYRMQVARYLYVLVYLPRFGISDKVRLTNLQLPIPHRSRKALRRLEMEDAPPMKLPRRAWGHGKFLPLRPSSRRSAHDQTSPEPERATFPRGHRPRGAKRQEGVGPLPILGYPFGVAPDINDRFSVTTYRSPRGEWWQKRVR